MIEKLKKLWFVFTAIIVLLQTVVTFLFLYLKSESEVLSTTIFVLACVYVVAFLLLCVMSASNLKFSHEAMARFKGSQRAARRFINLIMLAMNILLIINSGSGFVLAPIFMVVLNLFLIMLDIKKAEMEEKRARKRKQKLREKKNAADVGVENSSGGKNYAKHKKRRFIGDFAPNKNKTKEN